MVYKEKNAWFVYFRHHWSLYESAIYMVLIIYSKLQWRTLELWYVQHQIPWSFYDGVTKTHTPNLYISCDQVNVVVPLVIYSPKTHSKTSM